MRTTFRPIRTSLPSAATRSRYPAHSSGSASFLRWQTPPRSVTSRRTTVITAMGESSAVAGPAGRYFASVHGPDAADGQVRGFPGCERVDWSHLNECSGPGWRSSGA